MVVEGNKEKNEGLQDDSLKKEESMPVCQDSSALLSNMLHIALLLIMAVCFQQYGGSCAQKTPLSRCRVITSSNW